MKRIELDGANNVRDLGGIKNINGKVVKDKYFIRSNAINTLSDKDVEILVNEYGLKTIIDLRTDVETQELPDVNIANVQYFNIPVFGTEESGITKESTQDLSMLKMVPDMKELYIKMVTDENSIFQLRIIMNTIIEEESAILFHCTAGKDRTGIVAMLILAMLDVSTEEIVKDYLDTNYVAVKNAEEQYQDALMKTNDKEFSEGIRKVCIADEEYIRGAINTIENEFGSLKNFIVNKLEISEKSIEILRKNALV